MSSAVYYDYVSRLIRSMLKIPDSGSFQPQSQPQPRPRRETISNREKQENLLGDILGPN